VSDQPTLAFISFASYGICPFGSTVRVTVKPPFWRVEASSLSPLSSVNNPMSNLVIEVYVDSLYSAQE
jgi:hypothetical protein